MAQFTIEIADEQVETVITAICSSYGYNPVEPQDGLSPSQFANKKVRDFIAEVTTAYVVQQAVVAAGEAARASASFSITDPQAPQAPNEPVRTFSSPR